MSSLTCSPKVSTDNVSTCYTLPQLKKIAANYNKSHNDKINLNLKKKDLWNTLKEKNFDTCQNNEYCWLKQNYMKINSNISNFKESFRPEKPTEWENEPNKWLNTYNILNVMKQYEDKYNKFKFIGVFPIDFRTKIGNSCVSPEMCSLNIKDLLKKNKNRLGVVFNLDKHWQPGSHWTSLYINLDIKSTNYGAYYYDSVANKPPKEVIDFINSIKKQINKEISNKNKTTNNTANKTTNKTTKKFNFTYNKIEHQKSSTECGMFSIYFLDKCLKNVSFNNFIKNKKLNDDLVFKYRDKYFTKS